MFRFAPESRRLANRPGRPGPTSVAANSLPRHAGTARAMPPSNAKGHTVVDTNSSGGSVLEAARPSTRESDGRPEGGQWTRIGEGAEEGRIQLVQGDRLEGFPVDLREDEALGGHTISGHVGKSRDFLLNRIRSERLRIIEREPSLTRKQPQLFRGFAVSSFPSLEAAMRLVNSTLARNREMVDRIARGELPFAFVEWHSPSRTGSQAYLPRLHSEPFMRDTFGVRVYIIRDSRSPKGFRVQTAYPIR